MLPKFYYINLDKCEDRDVHMKYFFTKIENNYNLKVRSKRISGFDATSDEKNILKKINDKCSLGLDKLWHFKSKNIKAKASEFGCTFSHFLAINTFLNDSKNTDDYAFICEDDLDLFNINIQCFTEVINSLITQIDKIGIVSLSCVGSPIILNQLYDKLTNPIFLDYNSNKGSLYGTGCYIISRKQAKMIIDKHFENNKLFVDVNHETITADHFIYPQAEKCSFIIPSLFAIKEENESLIHPDHLMMQENTQRFMFELWKKFNVSNAVQKSIISNNEWGTSYLENTRNSPTNGTCFTPNDYITFLENFEDLIKIRPIHKEKSNTSYPVGILEFSDKKIEIHFINQKNWDDCYSQWIEGVNNLPKNRSNILFKMCDRDFKGRFEDSYISRFLNLKYSLKTIFISEFRSNRISDQIKRLNESNDFITFKKKYNYNPLRIIPKKESDSEKESCPTGNKLFKICGVK